MLHRLPLNNFECQSGFVADISVSYETFGQPLHSAPVVLVNHALTGNSAVAGENGWWNALVGEGKAINTEVFTIICFNVPGNGYDGLLIENYRDFCTRDIAGIFILALQKLGISKIHTLVGGSIGGAVGWEMLALQNGVAENFVAIATDYKTTDWLHSQCLVQNFLLEDKSMPLQKARIHAMLCYRTPESLNLRFNRKFDGEKQIWKSNEWLDYHGRSLSERFTLPAYRLMNHLLATIDAGEEMIMGISAHIHLIAVDSDLLFPASEVRNCFELLKKSGREVRYHEIKSIHGHDAFLMEYEQLSSILEKIMIP